MVNANQAQALLEAVGVPQMRGPELVLDFYNLLSLLVGEPCAFLLWRTTKSPCQYIIDRQRRLLSHLHLRKA